jgi:hypothetical protein
MKKLLLALLGFLFSISAFAEDTLWVTAHSNTQMVWHVNYDNKAYFPTEGKTFRKIIMYYTLGCAETGCSGWDYDVLTQIMHNTGKIDSSVQKLDTISQNPLEVDTTWRVFDVLEPYELGRLITPYGTYMRDNSNGFNNDWTHTFTYDVTDYASLLKDSVIIRSKYNGWSSGFSADIKFAFIEGTPQREVISIQNVYTRGGGYQNTQQFETNVIPAKTFAIPEGTASAQAKVLVTGHGNNQGTGCGEFCDKMYYYKVNGQQQFEHRMWRTDCNAVTVRPQGGTYLYPRANWCPGDKVFEQRFELTPFLAGDSITLDMDIEPYTLSGDGGASHNISSTVFFYGPDNYAFDAEIHRVIAPSDYDEHINYNPNCDEVIVVIKNNSRTPLTYAKIEYGFEGGKMRTGEWTGNLLFEEIDTVYLPTAYWDGVTNYASFTAKLITPNHKYNDDLQVNNTFHSNFNLVPRWEPFRLMLRTNGQAQENRLTITNHLDEVVYELNNLENNTTYNETLNLPAGCYELRLTDAGGDGLHWWVYQQTGQGTRINGFLRVLKAQGAGIYVNAADFGSEYVQSFIVGEMSVPEAPLTFVESFDIFPNPTTGKVNILIPALNNGEAKIEVIDRLGRILLERNNTLTDKEYWEELDITGLSEDLYIIRVSNGETVLTEKIFKQD